MNNIVCIIPARKGSKGILNKNIKKLNGKELFLYSIESAFKAGIQRVIVSSDSEEYGKIAKEYGAEFILRPSELAKDDTSMFEMLKSEIPKIEPIPEIVILLSPTSPLRKTIQIKTAISFFLANIEKYDSLMTVQKIPDKFNPAQVLITTSQGVRMANGVPLSNRIIRRQEYPNAYVTSGGIYIFKTSNLENGSFYGRETMLQEIEPTPDINTLEDFQECEKLLAEQQIK